MSYLLVFINAIVVALMAMYVYENERKMEKMSTRHDLTENQQIAGTRQLTVIENQLNAGTRKQAELESQQITESTKLTDVENQLLKSNVKVLTLEKKLVDEIKDMKQLMSTKAEIKKLTEIANQQLKLQEKVTCGSGWEQFMGSCYHFQFESKMTWDAAKIDCHRKGGFLVKIDNIVENWFLKSFMNVDNNPVDVWIGAHDSVQESRFVWESDNTVLTYTDWIPGEPNNYGQGQEDCAYMNSGAKYQWNDATCSDKYSFICEKH